MIKETYYGLNRANPDHLKRLQRVLSLQDEPRWRAAANLYLYLNPKSYVWDEKSNKAVVAMDARTEARIIADECTQLRQGMAESHNERGLSKGSFEKGNDAPAERIYSLRMPATMLQFIQMIDPDLVGTTKGEEGRQKWRRLKNEFKEFRVGIT